MYQRVSNSCNRRSVLVNKIMFGVGHRVSDCSGKPASEEERRARTCSGKRDPEAFARGHAHISPTLDMTRS